MVAFPTATRKSAFIAGFSLVLFIALLETLGSFGVFLSGSSEEQLFPVVILFFFVSVLLFVIDVKSLAPSEPKTKIPLLYFPANRAGLNFLLRVWGRMLVWFLGAATAAALMAFGQWLLK
ncbi:hypothetical protein [Azonexus sp. R2A61]|uniref:hypothetical protein n=1 Tax=Azonexus sp. R2A61 TaxID=2744443 RepID=UPI001F2A8F29|nr:hypothetical protein [Azonexus sp. R2A61]